MEESRETEPVPETPFIQAEDEPEAAEAAGTQPAAKQNVTRARAKAVMKSTLDLVGKLGAGAGSLLRRLKKDKSPEGMLNTLEERLAVITPRREAASARLETLYKEIVVKKKACAKATPARRRILEVELKSKLAEYKAVEREVKVLLENEKNINMVKARVNETLAYGMAGIDEDLIDSVAMDVDDAADDAEARADAVRDLERAGRRRERDDEGEDLWEQLDEFEDLGAEEEGEEAEEAPAFGALEDIDDEDLEEDEGERRAPEAQPE
jgi:hypothetical protein